MAQYQISTIAFERDGLVITYLDTATDVRVKGQVITSHQAMIGLDHPDYAQDALRLHGQAVRVLENALEDFADSEPFEPEDEDIDSDRGMGE